MKCISIGALMAVTSLVVTVANATPVLTIGSASATQGGTAVVNLDVSGLGGGTALGTYDVSVGFDPSLLGFISASYGDPSLGDQLDLEGFGTLTATTPGTGTVDFFELSLDTPDALTSSQASSFTLAALKFQALSAGVSPLMLSVNAVGDQNGSPIAAALQNGMVTVSSSQPTSVPEPPSLLLCVTGGLMLLLLRGKSRRRAGGWG